MGRLEKTSVQSVVCSWVLFLLSFFLSSLNSSQAKIGSGKGEGEGGPGWTVCVCLMKGTVTQKGILLS